MFLQNRNNFIGQMKNNTIALFYSGISLFKNGDQKFSFEVNRNFYYLTGINQENTILLFIKKNNQTQTFLFVSVSDQLNLLWNGEFLSFNEISEISKLPLPNILNILSFDKFLNQKINFIKNYPQEILKGIYLDLFCLPSEVSINWALKQFKFLSNLYPFLKIYNSSSIMFYLRKQKKPEELENIKKALHINHNALINMIKNIKKCKYEYQIDAHYNYYLEKNKTKKSFDTIAACGKNALILHYNKNNSLLNKNEILLFDAGVQYKKYSSDITRCYPISGTFNSFQKQIYNLVLETNKKIIKWVMPYHTISELNIYGKDIMTKGLKKLGLFKENTNINQYCYHNLGHHLGLDVHDLNFSPDDALGENSVFTVEPGLYLSDFNIGIRIEDNILIKNNGAINLSKHIPKEIFEIENLIQKFI
ncbi:aminopeptidase P N-terminal domain-containing protein [Candidatus Phytoplasma prunorum]|uniref:aminopeptidase P N-terminal domain-containing protein n=1 Tax=Candidatus Phytoplasma prunorum TaxID=47565 RepID=UPI002FEEE5CD